MEAEFGAKEKVYKDLIAKIEGERNVYHAEVRDPAGLYVLLV